MVVHAAQAIGGAAGTAERPGQIKIATRAQGDMASHHNGTGIPESIPSRIFDRFSSGCRLAA